MGGEQNFKGRERERQFVPSQVREMSEGHRCCSCYEISQSTFLPHPEVKGCRKFTGSGCSVGLGVRARVISWGGGCSGGRA